MRTNPWQCGAQGKNGEVSYLFHPLDLGNAAVRWIFGIEGETPLQDRVMDSLPDPTLPMPSMTSMTAAVLS